jgi:hypothetical protein
MYLDDKFLHALGDLISVWVGSIAKINFSWADQDLNIT